jgi:hypothetical protein
MRLIKSRDIQFTDASHHWEGPSGSVIEATEEELTAYKHARDRAQPRR